ncbi:GLIPR1-like protein 1 [Nannospalax galili]|uniref:GLIPR1-like protein 1 n=1 Tax=Nannospalax galili TaxID=1026970 RepID=UPI0004ED3A40|nr:GLIPR1-like protein 1 [Nannospalax galili]
MALKKKFSGLWALGLCLIASKPAKVASELPKVPSIKDPRFIEECVSHHNEWRGKVNPPAANMKYMSWDKELARLARSWSTGCKFSHNPCITKRYACHDAFDFVGENIFLGGLKSSPKFVISSWYNESKYYNFDNLSCSKTCGHYTQVVWAKSHKVGCAVTNCPNLGGRATGLFICNYGPAGNYANTYPYIKGKPCSQCPDGSECLNNTCW